ncbi:MAG: hypothetical protein RIR88_684 [Actinomycetota bacterium]
MQQLNPLGSGGMWDAALLIGLAVWSYVVIMTLVQFTLAVYPAELVLSGLMFSIAIGTHLWAAVPRHAPYRATPFHVVAGASTAGAILQIFALHTSDVRMSVVWGPVAAALLMASASVYRPSKDLYGTGLLMVGFMALAVIIDGQAVGHPFGIGYVTIAVVGIVVIIVVGQASYTGVATRTVDAWNRNTASATRERVRDVREKVASDVTLQLSREFVSLAEPLLVSIIQSDRISSAETEQAREIAGQLRGRLLELNAQNWLQAAGSDVVDEENLVNHIDESVRAALVALCVGMQATGLDRPLVVIRSGTQSGAIRFRMSAPAGVNLAKTRVDLAPYIRVAYVVFDDVRVSYRAGEVTLKFQYGDK